MATWLINMFNKHATARYGTLRFAGNPAILSRVRSLARRWFAGPGGQAGVCLVLAALLLAGCTDSHDPDDPVVTMACVRSFATTLAAWKVYAHEQVPEQCQFLDADYDVQLVSAEEMPPQCQDGGPGTELVGCTLAGEKVIYLLEGRDPLDTLDTSVHEWIHALSACVLGDPDVGHYRAGLWEDSQPTSVEVRAQAAAVLGQCL